MRVVLAGGVAALVLAVASCSADPPVGGTARAGAARADAAQATTAAPPKPVTEPEVDRGTRKAARQTLDEAFDRLLDDGSGTFASYVNFGGSAMKVEGSFDLVDRELEALTSFSPSSAKARATGVRSRVVGEEIYGGPDFGPFAKCWFHYAKGSLDEILSGGVPFDEKFASYPATLVLAADARPIGSLEGDSFRIRSKVSGQAALAALSPQLLQKISDQLPDKDPSVEATVSIENGRFRGVTIVADEVVEAYDREGADLFEDDEGLENSFRAGTLYATFGDFGRDVTVDVPPLDSVIEFAGVDDVDSSGTTCAAAEG